MSHLVTLTLLVLVYVQDSTKDCSWPRALLFLSILVNHAFPLKRRCVFYYAQVAFTCDVYGVGLQRRWSDNPVTSENEVIIRQQGQNQNQ